MKDGWIYDPREGKYYCDPLTAIDLGVPDRVAFDYFIYVHPLIAGRRYAWGIAKEIGGQGAIGGRVASWADAVKHIVANSRVL